ncbi:hypothetical protein ACIBG8_15315 [Nonomuraea sp. NPDC050556]|uniref:hypothetical protein n=1 Tax=Nonomuraea sp. NPDC050556 TaxID=3364369 RepID=UPI00379FF4B1
MSDDTTPKVPEDAQPEPQDEVEALVDELEVHSINPNEFTEPCSGGCTGTC